MSEQAEENDGNIYQPGGCPIEIFPISEREKEKAYGQKGKQTPIQIASSASIRSPEEITNGKQEKITHGSQEREVQMAE